MHANNMFMKSIINKFGESVTHSEQRKSTKSFNNLNKKSDRIQYPPEGWLTLDKIDSIPQNSNENSIISKNKKDSIA